VVTSIIDFRCSECKNDRRRQMIIRTEEIKDYQEVYNLNFEAFDGRDDEAVLIEKVRTSDYFVPELSLVAEIEGKIAGHLLLSKANVIEGENNHHEVIVLAPIAVKPEFQKSGIGGKLILEGLKRCRDLGYSLVFLIGHPDYYPKFGFKPARQFRIELKQFHVPDHVFMVCELVEGKLNVTKGELKYPETFLS